MFLKKKKKKSFYLLDKCGIEKEKQLEMILLLLVKNCLKIMQFTNIIIVFEFDKMFVKKYVLYLPNVRTTIKYAFALKLTAFNIIVTFV